MPVTGVTTPPLRATFDPIRQRSTATARVGILGTGFMGRVHAAAVRAAGGELVGVLSSSRERSEAAAVALRAERAFDSLPALLDSVDVLHVCTPNSLHHEGAMAAIEAGVHVVCEKPLATSLDQALAMREAAQRAGVVATVPFVYRFHPMVREMRARIARGDAGLVSSIHGSYLQDWLSRADDSSWRLDAAAGGATRAFGDIGSHLCDLLEFATGDRIARLSARTSIVHDRGPVPAGTTPTEDVATVSFETTRGVVGVLVVSQVAAGRKNRLHLSVSGTETSHVFDQELPELLWVGRREGSQLLLRDPASLTEDAARLSVLPAGHAQGYQDCFNAFAADTYRAVAGESVEGLPTFDDGVRAAQVTEAVLVSAAGDSAWTEVSA